MKAEIPVVLSIAESTPAKSQDTVQEEPFLKIIQRKVKNQSLAKVSNNLSKV